MPSGEELGSPETPTPLGNAGEMESEVINDEASQVVAGSDRAPPEILGSGERNTIDIISETSLADKVTPNASVKHTVLVDSDGCEDDGPKGTGDAFWNPKSFDKADGAELDGAKAKSKYVGSDDLTSDTGGHNYASTGGPTVVPAGVVQIAGNVAGDSMPVAHLIFRAVWSWNLFAATLTGLAVSASLVLQFSYVVARGLFDPWYYGEAVAGAFLLPCVNVFISWLIDEAIDLVCDTFSASAWEGILGFSGSSATVKNPRAQFIYMTNGKGYRPTMLRFRAALAAVLTVLFVPVQRPREFKDTPKGTDFGKNVKEPLFRIPTAISVVVDIIFVTTFALFPIVYSLWAAFGVNGSEYDSFLSCVSSTVFVTALIAPIVYTMLHFIIYFNTRAACLFAFACGEDTAEVGFKPYTISLLDRQVIAEPVSYRCGCCRGCVGCCERYEDENGEIHALRQSCNGASSKKRLLTSAPNLREWDKGRVDVFGVTPEHLASLHTTPDDEFMPGPQDVGALMRLGSHLNFALRLLWKSLASCFGRSETENSKVTSVSQEHPKSCDRVALFCKRWFISPCLVQTRSGSLESRRLLCSMRIIYALLSILVTILSSIIFGESTGIVVFKFSVGFMTFLLGISIYYYAHPLIGRSFVAVMVMQLAFQLSLSSQMPSVLTSPVHKKDSSLNFTIDVSKPNSVFTQVVSSKPGPVAGWPSPAMDYLPICTLRTDKNRYFGTLDAAALALIIYNDDGGLSEAGALWHGGPLSDVRQTEYVQQGQDLPKDLVGKTKSGGSKSRIRYASWNFTQAKVIAYSIAGTSTMLDALIDGSYYALQSTLKMSGFLVPFNSLLPLTIIQTMIEVVSGQGAFEPTEFLDLLDKIEMSKKENPEWTHVVTGHSLGGAYANIVAARAGISAISFSPPGLYLGTRKMGMKFTSDLFSHLTNVIPEYDIVPKADGHAGTIAHIPCSISSQATAIEKGIACHSMHRTLGILALACRDTHYPHRIWNIIDVPNSQKPIVVLKRDADGKSISADSLTRWPHGWSSKT